MKNNQISLFKLYLLFIKIGCLSFGGGPVVLSFVIEELSKKRKLISEVEMLKLVTICQMLPGVFSISIATYSGYLLKKIWGAILSCLGVITPSFILITLVYFLSNTFLTNEYVNAFFIGIRIGVCFLIINAGIKLFIKSNLKIFDFILLLATILMSLFLHFNTVVIILIYIILGISLYIMEIRDHVFKIS